MDFEAYKVFKIQDCTVIAWSIFIQVFNLK